MIREFTVYEKPAGPFRARLILAGSETLEEDMKWCNGKVVKGDNWSTSLFIVDVAEQGYVGVADSCWVIQDEFDAVAVCHDSDFDKYWEIRNVERKP